VAKRTASTQIVGLDIGTSKVCVLIADEREGELTLLGFGIAKSAGMRKGAIINLEAVEKAISAAVEEAELMAGVGIERAYIGISGGHIKSFNSRGSISLPEDHPKITREDIARVISAARAVAIPSDREVIHLLPQEFMIDDDHGVHDPLGLSGRRLEVGVHIVTGSSTSLRNVVACAQNAGIEVVDTVLLQLAAGLSTLSDDEKELGVALLDVGGGTTDMAVHIDGALWHTAVLPIAGDHITNDIAVGLRTPIPVAEEIKIEHGAAVPSASLGEGSIEVATIGEGKSRVVDRETLVEIINARVEEDIFKLVKEELRRIGALHRLNAGIVLTGGSAKLRGIIDLAEQVFEMPVRLAVPTGFGGIVDAIAKPEFSAVAGLVQFGYDNNRSPAENSFPKDGPLSRLWQKLRGKG
jgi:cell division protein FtsA